jgi:uncharacterized protein
MLAALLLAVATAAAQEQSSLPPPPERYFNDYAMVASPAEARRLEDKLRRFDEETSSQVVVAVMPRLTWPSMEDFTARTAESWKVGRKELDNGAVFFVFVEDRKMRIEVGYGLEGALPDVTAKRILEEVVAPAFREGRYGDGLEKGVDAIIAATRGEYTAPPRKRSVDSGPVALLLPIGFVILILFLSNRIDRPLGPIPRGRRRRRSWYLGGPGFGGGWGGGRRGGWGGGGFGGGGGFSGGGGSFGGGGASGSW